MGNISSLMSLKKLLRIFFRTGFIQFGLVILFYLVFSLSNQTFLENNQATILIALFSFFIASVLNVIGILLGCFFVGLINKNIAYYLIIIIVPLIFSSVALLIFNKLESKYLIFLVPAFMAFTLSHVILYFSISKNKS